MEEALKAGVLILLCWVRSMRGCSQQEYFTNDDLLQHIDQMAANDPSLASSYTIGFSGHGTELRVLRISAAPEDALVPQVKLIGGIHGDEPPSTHVLVNFAEHLISGYNSGERYITWLLNNTRIHILPRLNPDGFSEALEGECSFGPGRKNGNGVDLNRAFPSAHMDEDVLLPQFQPEVEAVMRWTEDERFVIGAGLHTGALVAVYPLDCPLGDEREGEKAKTRDDDIFVHMAEVYARNHISMADGLGCEGRDRFPGGIVNGAEWYRASGSMMDYSYLFGGTMELTLELYCCKYPPPRFLCHIWEHNKLSLLKFCAESVRGVRGVVTSSGIPLEMATVTVLGRDMVITTNSKGQFFRVLLPGRYFIQVEMIGMKSKILEVEIAWQATSLFTWTEVNVDLQPDVLSPAEVSTQPEAISTSQPAEPATLTPVSSTADISFTPSSEEAVTFYYDPEGLDPSLPSDKNTDLIENEKFLPNDTSLFETKNIFNKSGTAKLCFLLYIFPILIMVII